MRQFWLAIFFVGSLFGQLESDTVTVTSTRTLVVPPNTVRFTATAVTPKDASKDEVLAMLAPAGITPADLTDVTGTSQSLTWNFSWSVPIERLKDAVAALVPVRARFNVTGAQVSPDLLVPSRCPTSEVLADAQNQAQKMAAAAGARLGPMLSAANPSTLTPDTVLVVAEFGSSLTGIPAARVAPVLSTQLNCSLTVKFRLNR